MPAPSPPLRRPRAQRLRPGPEHAVSGPAEPARAPQPVDAPRIEQAILALLGERMPGKTICPSEVARALAGNNNDNGEAQWRALMPAVREAAERLATAGKLQVTQRGKPVSATQARGPVRLGHPAQ